MVAFGVLLYLLFFLLVLYFYNKRGGRSLQELIERGAHEHVIVHQILAQHPRGGRWREFKEWLKKGQGPR